MVTMAKKSIDSVIKAGLAQPRLATYVPPAGSAISTGCTLLNLACSGNVDYATHAGQYIYFVGDSGSGKTMLVLQLFAEACRSSFYDKHSLVYDNTENGALMDMQRLFGRKAAARIRNPLHGSSRTAEAFYANVDKEVAAGPVIYILDSMDGLTTLGELAHSKKLYKAALKDQAAEAADNGPDDAPDDAKAPGSYGTDKAATNSEQLRQVVGKLEASNSILVIISQTRDAIGGGPFAPKKTHSGGHALDFYAHLTIWTKTIETVTKTVNGSKRPVGIVAEAKVRKNRVNGLQRSVSVPIYPSVGVDNVGGMVSYLLQEKLWPQDKSGYITTDYVGPDGKPVKLRYEDLVGYIENNDLTPDLTSRVQELWSDIESKLTITRRPRYD